MGANRCLPPKVQASASHYAFSIECNTRLDQRRIRSHPFICRPNHGQLKLTFALFLSLLAVPFTGCGGASVMVPSASGTFQASTDSVDFGTVTVEQTADSSVILVNQSSTAIQVSDLNVSGSGFTVANTSNVPFSVPANGGTYNLGVQFKPITTDDSTGQLTVANSSMTSSALRIKLHGRGSVPTSTNPTLSAVACSQSAMTGAGSDACTVTLNSAALTGGTAVTLSSNNSAVTVPSSVTVAAGATSANFTATVAAVTSAQTSTLTATAGGVSKTFALQLSVSQATVSALTCTSSSITGAGTDACTVTLSAAAPTGGTTVTLSSSNSAVTVPSSITISAGSTNASFMATVSAGNSTQSVTLTATAGSVSKTYALQLNAGVSTLGISVSSISFGSISINTATSQTVTLSSTGTAAVTINSATVTGTGFSLSGMTFPATLNPGQNAALSVVFDPTATGAVTGQVTFSSNSSTKSTATISLSGTGTAATHQVNLTWDAPSSSTDPVTGYNLYRATSGTVSYILLNSSSSTQLSYADSTVKSGQSYNYIVKSVDASGVESDASNITTATIP
jgi:hypothetical protein